VRSAPSGGQARNHRNFGSRSGSQADDNLTRVCDRLIVRAAPGHYTGEVLARLLGYDRARLAELREAKVIARVMLPLPNRPRSPILENAGGERRLRLWQ
jgi:hypothetical protein